MTFFHPFQIFCYKEDLKQNNGFHIFRLTAWPTKIGNTKKMILRLSYEKFLGLFFCKFYYKKCVFFFKKKIPIYLYLSIDFILYMIYILAISLIYIWQLYFPSPLMNVIDLNWQSLKYWPVVKRRETHHQTILDSIRTVSYFPADSLTHQNRQYKKNYIKAIIWKNFGAIFLQVLLQKMCLFF
jgi:hypothetical protein